MSTTSINAALEHLLDEMTPLLGLDGSRRCILKGAVVEAFAPYVRRDESAKPALRWSKELPTKPGLYWVRRKHDIPMQIAHVVLLEGHLMCTIGHQGGFLKYHTGYEWAGPLETPAEKP